MSRLHKYYGVAGGLTGTVLAFAVTPALAGAPCTGPGAPTTTQTRCVTAIQIPGNALRSYDISWVNPERHEYYLGDRSNNGIDIIDTKSLTFKRTIKGFVGVKLNAAGTAVNNNISGPDGVASHGRWLYAGDGDSTLKVVDLDAPVGGEIKQTLQTDPGAAAAKRTRLDELALTTNGNFLIGANNAADPPFVTLFKTNGDAATSNVSIVQKIVIDNSIVPEGAGLAIEQPTWEPRTARFYTSVPTIANNPVGCNYGQLAGPITCSGGLMITDPLHPTATVGAYNSGTHTGIVKLRTAQGGCGPNGITVGPHRDLLLGCTEANLPSGVTTLIVNARTLVQTIVTGLVGSDEVWFNKGDRRYYTASNRDLTGGAQVAQLGVVDARTKTLIEKIPQSSGSHSLAADEERNLIFVPQSAPVRIVGAGGDTTAVGEGICGSTNGCIAVYASRRDDDDNDDRDSN